MILFDLIPCIRSGNVYTVHTDIIISCCKKAGVEEESNWAWARSAKCRFIADGLKSREDDSNKCGFAEWAC